MLQIVNDSIKEVPALTTAVTASNTGYNYYDTTGAWIGQTVYWNSYPVYVCTDKTKKAIEVLKALQAEKLLDCKSVPRFIELVEKIAGIL